MSRLVEDVLGAWRDAERLLGDLPPVDPDHETVRLTIDGLRQSYRELTTARDNSRQSLRNSEDTLERARELLVRVANRMRPDEGTLGAGPTS